MKRIVSATIIPSNPSQGYFKAKVLAKLDDGQEGVIFDYYDDELSFAVDEFVGLTVEEAHELFLQRDIEYLRS